MAISSSVHLPGLLKRRFGDGYFRELWKEFLVFRALGGLRDDGDRYELTRRGRYFWVMMMREFFTGVNNFMLSRRFSIVDTSAPSGSGITDGPMLISPILTRLPTTKPETTASMFLAMGFTITYPLESVVVALKMTSLARPLK